MAGHRDDGTFAEDKAHHPGRKISKYSLIWGNEHGVHFVDTQGASSEDWLKHGPPCDYCGAEAGKPCLEGCQGH